MKNLPLILGIIVILLLGIGGYWYMNKNPTSLSTGKNKMEQEQTTGSGMMSLKELMGLNKNQVCTYSSSEETGSISGTSYISGGKVRNEFKGTYPDGKAYEGGMINDGSYMYTWTTDSNEGFKIAITDSIEKQVEDTKNDFEKNQDQFVNQNEKLNYKCSSWSPNGSMFVPPSNIKFTDYSEMMNQTQEAQPNSEQIKEFLCKNCDNVPEAEQAACKQSLGCE